MDKVLNQFHNDVNMRDSVKGFFLRQLEIYALEQVFEMKDTKHIAAAKEIIEKSFIQLKELYEQKKETKVLSSR